MSANADPQIVHGIEENKDGEITNLVLSPADATAQEKVAYDGACKNIGDGLNYAAFDHKGIRHALKVNDKGEIVTDDDKKLKSMFDKELDEKEVKKQKEPEKTTTKVSSHKPNDKKKGHK